MPLINGIRHALAGRRSATAGILALYYSSLAERHRQAYENSEREYFVNTALAALAERHNTKAASRHAYQ